MTDTVRESKIDGMARKAGRFARICDALFVLVFAYLAITSSGSWAVFWGVCSAFCLFTAITNPLEKIPALMDRIMGIKRG